MPQLYYGGDILRETTAGDQQENLPPLGSLHFYDGGSGYKLRNISPPGVLQVFECTNSEDTSHYIFASNQESIPHWSCTEYRWLLIPTGKH
jgi:hypothetical protein